jgi:DNA helicase-4
VHAGDQFRGILDELDRFLEQVRSYLPEPDRGRVTISTTHKYKGLEQSAVIVLDALDRSYPLIHPTWVFLRVFGDTIEALEEEERRLFYVATTRAAGSLAIVTAALAPAHM